MTTALSVDLRAGLLFLDPPVLVDQLWNYVLDEDTGDTLTIESSGISMNLHVYRRAVNLSIDERKAWFAAATTNYCLNPSFEVNVTDDWTLGENGGSGGSKNLDATQYYIGTRSCRVRAGTAANDIQTVANVSVPNGITVTISTYVRCSANPAGAKAYIWIYDTTTPAVRGQANATLTTTWERLSVSWTNTTGVTCSVGPSCRNNFNNSAADVWFDACQLELQPAATPYCDGSLGAGYSWAGTAHNSTSSRTQLGTGLHASKRRVAMSADERE